jgi:D-glycero-alpha-D-manno-heptose-7-phosphate kinase
MRIVRARCPLRLSFAGGGTDVPPYTEEKGGAVLVSTIDKYAFATITGNGGSDLCIESLDYDVVAKYRVENPLPLDGSLDLVKAAINRVQGPKTGLKVFLHNDAPPGSGLGSSSAIVVAVVGAFNHWLNKPFSDYEIASLAWQVERLDMGIKGGLQDQYACTFGGFNFIEFTQDAVIVNPLRVCPDVISELSYRLLLCYTGRSRTDGRIMDNQIDGYRRHEVDVMRALDEMKAITIQMKNDLLRGHLDDFGELLHAGWENKRKLAAGIATPEIDELYEVARRNGALGGKISGAGGGGYMMFCCEFDKRHRLAEAVERLGAQVVEFSFESAGIQAWETRSTKVSPSLVPAGREP